jgi:hypothetical protein
VLRSSIQDEVRDAMQYVGFAIELLEGVAGGAVGIDGCGAGFFHAVQGWISRFVRARILAWRLSEIFGGCSHVEKVVSDLK